MEETAAKHLTMQLLKIGKVVLFGKRFLTHLLLAMWQDKQLSLIYHRTCSYRSASHPWIYFLHSMTSKWMLKHINT